MQGWLCHHEFFSCSLSWKYFTPPLKLKESFAVCISLGWNLFSCKTCSTLLYALLDLMVCKKKSAIILMGFPWNVTCFFSLASFSILFLCWISQILIIICLDVVLIGLMLFGVVYTWVTWNSFASLWLRF